MRISDWSSDVCSSDLFPRFGRPEFDWPTFPPTRDFTTHLVDPDSGEEIEEPKRPGEMRIAGPGIFLGYYGEPKVTQAEFDKSGSHRTGAVFEIAGAGHHERKNGIRTQREGGGEYC